MSIQEQESATEGERSGVEIVNWNNYEDTAACLDSLADLSSPVYQVTVVDNGSTDGSGQRLAAEYGWCDVVFNEENRGFGGGCNTGIEQVLASDVEFVVLLKLLSIRTVTPTVVIVRCWTSVHLHGLPGLRSFQFEV